MRRGEVFWGALLVILGGLFLLKAAGSLPGDVLGWFWPIFLMAAGVWVLLDRRASHGSPAGERFSVPLQGAKEASLRIDQGVGRIELSAGGASNEFLSGITAVGMTRSAALNGERLDVKIEAGPSFIPYLGPEGATWRYRMNPEVPTSLSIHSGASRLDLDLSQLRIAQFSFEGGASSLNLRLPSRVENVLATIQAGAASIDAVVPDGVALRLKIAAVGSLDVDKSRFPENGSDTFQSPDYDSAKYRVALTVEGGGTSVRVH